MSKRPGVLLYFDRVLFLDRLTDEQNGQIFRAAIQYARDGVAPVFNDPALLIAWDFLRPALDEDAESYIAKCEKNRQNAVKRWHTNAYDHMPNTNTSTSTNTNQTHPQTQSQRNDLALAERMLAERKKGTADG